ncbi:MAG: glycosyltransferase family 2 protein [Mycobacteriaceae bacterium]|nr:glycosyltransferase family 2 protein [Mycobacteriaceae bacterium]
MITLSIIMPVYNESATVAAAIERALAVEYPCLVELIVVDDGSTDDTTRVLRSFAERGVRLLCHPVNRGKGAAVLTGVRRATGTHVLILDADLEYSPADIPNLLSPVLNGVSDHVFGSRIFGLNTRFPSFRFAIGGRITTAVANVLFDSCLTDMHTCLKLVPLAHFRALTLSQRRFGLDTELTATMLRAGVRPYEVPISYNGRSIDDGKKISWRDGWECLGIMLMVRLRRPKALPLGPFYDPLGLVVAMPAKAASPYEPRPDGEVVNAAP